MAFLRAAGSLAGLARSAQRSSLSFNAGRVVSQRALYAAEAAPEVVSDTDGSVTQVRCLTPCLGLSRAPSPPFMLAPETGPARWGVWARPRDVPGFGRECSRPTAVLTSPACVIAVVALLMSFNSLHFPPPTTGDRCGGGCALRGQAPPHSVRPGGSGP